MKILITGAKGMLAQAVRERFLRDAEGKENELILTDVAPGEIEVVRGETVEKLTTIGLDITDSVAVDKMVDGKKPELIINCAAYTDVDKAEIDSELARKINTNGPGYLAIAAKRNDAILVHISTDYVFGGDRPTDIRDPRSVYYEYYRNESA